MTYCNMGAEQTPGGGYESWVADAGNNIEKGTSIAGDGSEFGILTQIEETLRQRREPITPENYFELVDGERGDVPEEFDDRARTVLSIVRFDEDRALLAEVLAEIDGEVEPRNRTNFERVRGLLTESADEEREALSEQILGRDDEAAAYRDVVVGRNMRDVADGLSSLDVEVGQRFNLDREARRLFFRSLKESFGQRVAKGIEVPGEGMMADTEERDRWLRTLFGVVAGQKVQRTLEGRQSFIRLEGDWDIAIPGGQPAGEKSKAIMEAMTNGLSETVLTPYEEDREEKNWHRSEDVINSLTALAEGLVIGSGFDELIESSTELSQISERRLEDLDIRPKRGIREKYGKKGEAVYPDAVAIGYFASVLDRGDIDPRENLDAVHACRIALDSIDNQDLKNGLLETVRAMNDLTEGESLAIALILEDRSLAQEGLEEEFSRVEVLFRERLRKQTIKDIRDELYISDKAVFGLPESFIIPGNRLFRGGLESGIDDRDQLVNAFARREATFQIATRLMDSMSTDIDAQGVLEVVRRIGQEGFQNIQRKLIREELKDLDEGQKRFAAMMWQAQLMSVNIRRSGMNADQKARAVNDLVENGDISAADIIMTHNIVVAVNDGVNAAAARETGDEPPLVLHGFIDTLDELREKKSGSSRLGDRISPFIGYRLFPLNFQRLDSEGVVIQDFKGSRDSDVKPMQLVTQGRRDAVGEDVDWSRIRDEARDNATPRLAAAGKFVELRVCDYYAGLELNRRPSFRKNMEKRSPSKIASMPTEYYRDISPDDLSQLLGIEGAYEQTDAHVRRIIEAIEDREGNGLAAAQRDFKEVAELVRLVESKLVSGFDWELDEALKGVPIKGWTGLKRPERKRRKEAAEIIRDGMIDDLNALVVGNSNAQQIINGFNVEDLDLRQKEDREQLLGLFNRIMTIYAEQLDQKMLRIAQMVGGERSDLDQAAGGIFTELIDFDDGTVEVPDLDSLSSRRTRYSRRAQTKEVPLVHLGTERAYGYSARVPLSGLLLIADLIDSPLDGLKISREDLYADDPSRDIKGSGGRTMQADQIENPVKPYDWVSSPENLLDRARILERIKWREYLLIEALEESREKGLGSSREILADILDRALERRAEGLSSRKEEVMGEIAEQVPSSVAERMRRELV